MYHDILLAVQTEKTDAPDRLTLKADDFRYDLPMKWRSASDCPKQCKHCTVADRCNVTLKLNQILLAAISFA